MIWSRPRWSFVQSPVADVDEVALLLPRFGIEGSLSLDAMPLTFGLGACYESPRSPWLSSYNVVLTSVTSHALVRVAELGVEAAAVTAVAMAGAAFHPPRRTLTVAFDRPFGVTVLGGTVLGVTVLGGTASSRWSPPVGPQRPLTPPWPHPPDRTVRCPCHPVGSRWRRGLLPPPRPRPSLSGQTRGGCDELASAGSQTEIQ